MRYVAKKANERFGQGFGQNPFNTSTTTKTEGDVTIDKSQANTKTTKSSVGEYVDFEEVD